MVPPMIVKLKQSVDESFAEEAEQQKRPALIDCILFMRELLDSDSQKIDDDRVQEFFKLSAQNLVTFLQLATYEQIAKYTAPLQAAFATLSKISKADETFGPLKVILTARKEQNLDLFNELLTAVRTAKQTRHLIKHPATLSTNNSGESPPASPSPSHDETHRYSQLWTKFSILKSKASPAKQADQTLCPAQPQPSI